MKKDKRFVFGKSEGMVSGATVITDTDTGVQYLFVASGYAGGLTVLLDENGKPLVDKTVGTELE